MPELPEVETVARDLRPRIVGATIVGARTNWARTLRSQDPVAFADGVAGRTVMAVGRRAKQLVVELIGRCRPDDPPQDDRPALRRAGRERRGPVRAARPRAGRRSRAALPRHPQVRQDRAVRPRSADRRAGRGRRRAAVFAAVGPEPLDDAFTLRDFRRRIRRRKGRLKPLLTDQSFLAGVGNIYADEALWRARLHPLRSAPSLRPPDERPPVRGDPAVLGRGGRASRLVDRRLHRARRRRLDAGAARGLPAHRRALPALRPSDPADRDRRPVDALLLVVPAAARRRPAASRADPRGR